MSGFQPNREKRLFSSLSKSNPCFGSLDYLIFGKNPETKDKLISFALVTRPPTKYIEEVGHDRCPAIMTTEQPLAG